MRKILSIIYCIALFTSLTFAQTDWYVNKNATGSNNGTSWANAWKSFSAINWASVGIGDDIYISGGIDSTVYYETLEPNIKGNTVNWSIITAGKFSPSPYGHSGKVIIDGGNYSRDGVILRNGGNGKPSYMRIKEITFRNIARGVDANFDEKHVGIAIDNCRFENHGDRAIIFETLLSFGVDSIFIENNYMLSSAMSNSESDGIFLKGTSRNFIHNNWIRVRNQDPVQHVDALQSYLCDGFIITNNIFINDSVNSVEGGGIPIILGSQGSNPVIIYNNFCYMGGVWYSGGNWAGTLMTRWYDVTPMPPTWILHNTVVSNGPRVRGMWLEYSSPTTTRVINNLIAQYSTTTNGVLGTFDNSTGSTLRVDSIRNNLFYQSWGTNVGFAGNLNGSGRTGTPSGWTDFVNNYGGTGVKGNPLLVNNIGYEPNQSKLNWQLREGSPATNKGENAKWYINYLNETYKLNNRLKWESANGIQRGVNPTIGAYEFGSNPVIIIPNVRDSIVYIPGGTIQKDTTVYLPGEIINRDTIVTMIVDSVYNKCVDDTVRIVYIQLPPTIEYNYTYVQLPPTINYNYKYNYIPSDTVCIPVMLDSNYVPITALPFFLDDNLLSAEMCVDSFIVNKFYANDVRIYDTGVQD